MNVRTYVYRSVTQITRARCRSDIIVNLVQYEFGSVGFGGQDGAGMRDEEALLMLQI